MKVLFSKDIVLNSVGQTVNFCVLRYGQRRRDHLHRPSPRTDHSVLSEEVWPNMSQFAAFALSFGGFLALTSHFVTSMTAPVASGWSVRRVGLAPTGKRRLLTAHANSGHYRRRRETNRPQTSRLHRWQPSLGRRPTGSIPVSRMAAAAGHVNSVTSLMCHAFHEKSRETYVLTEDCVLVTENSASLGAPPQAGPPRVVSTSH